MSQGKGTCIQADAYPISFKSNNHMTSLQDLCQNAKC